MHKNRKVGIIGIIITVILLIILVIFTNMNINKFSNSQSIFSKLVMPIQNGLTYIKNKVFKNNAFFEDINNLKAENEELKKAKTDLESQIRELEILKSENTKLREYVNLTDKYTEYTTVPADIINKDISNLSSIMVINVGLNNGVKENMPVITGEGLVGYVISVTNDTAKVEPIIDPASSVSSTISTSRDTVMVKGILGNSNKLKMTYIPTDANLMLEDTIQTSGIGEIYPKGIIIGTLKEIVETQNITDRYAIVETAVDFSKIDTVLVITEN